MGGRITIPESLPAKLEQLLHRLGAENIAVIPMFRCLTIRFVFDGTAYTWRAVRKRKRIQWTPGQDAILRDRYPTTANRILADELAVHPAAVDRRARQLGLRKSPEWLRVHRFRPGRRRSPATEFKPGQTSWNKGRKMRPETYAKCSATMFRPGQMSGQAQSNYKPIGSLRVTGDGILERKVTDDPTLYPARRWVSVARLVWEAEHGPIPDGHLVVFKPGCHTTCEQEITLDRLELITRAENMQRNTIHNLPPELVDVIRVKARLQRQINKRERHAEQD